MSRILLAISSSYAADRVAATVTDLARKLGAEVLIVHVSRPSGGQMHDQEQAEGELAISGLRRQLQDQSIAVQSLLLFSDDIAQAIQSTAEERGVTLIVLGLTGKNVFARLLAGNVPVELIKNTRVPVLLLPPDWNKTL